MPRVQLIMLALVATLAGAAQGQVKVEVPTSATQTLLNTVGAEYGIAVQSALPREAGSQELISAYLWLEVTTPKGHSEKQAVDRDCVAVAALAGDGSGLAGEPGEGVPIPIGEKRSICFDVTAIVREQIRERQVVSCVAVVPCPDEGQGRVVSLAAEGPVAGWIEYSFYDKAKRDRLSGQ